MIRSTLFSVILVLISAIAYGCELTPTLDQCTTTLPQGGNLASAIASLTPPATLCLQSGSTPFVLTSSISIPSNVEIQGLGQKIDTGQQINGQEIYLPACYATTIQAQSSFSGDMFDITSTTGIKINNLTINGNTTTSVGPNTNLTITGGSSITLSDVQFKNVVRMNLAINQAQYVTLLHDEFRGMGGGHSTGQGAVGSMWINNSNHVDVENANVLGRGNGPGGDGGIDCYGSSSVTINQSNISESGESSIYTTNSPGQSACNGIVITNNIIGNSWEWGIDTVGLSGANIANNNISNTYYGGISMWNDSNNVVQNNQMFNINTDGSSGDCDVTFQGTNVNNTVVNSGSTCSK